MTTLHKIIIGLGVIGIAAIVNFTPKDEPEPLTLTVNEWQAIVKIYDYEIQQAGGEFQIEDWTSKNYIEKLNDKVRERIPKEGVEIDGVEMTPEDYEVFRDNLLEKTEKQSLIDKIKL